MVEERWVERWRERREADFAMHLLTTGFFKYGAAIFLAIAAGAYERGYLARSWGTLALGAFGAGIAIALISWFWNEARYNEHLNAGRR